MIRETASSLFFSWNQARSMRLDALETPLLYCAFQWHADSKIQSSTDKCAPRHRQSNVRRRKTHPSAKPWMLGSAGAEICWRRNSRWTLRETTGSQQSSDQKNIRKTAELRFVIRVFLLNALNQNYQNSARFVVVFFPLVFTWNK